MSDETDSLSDRADWEEDYRLIDETIVGMNRRYSNAQVAKTGDDIQCPTCEKRMKKIPYNKIFCRKVCKDRYWNLVDFKRTERAKLWTTRVIP